MSLPSGPITNMVAIGVTVVSTQEQDVEVDGQVLTSCIVLQNVQLGRMAKEIRALCAAGGEFQRNSGWPSFCPFRRMSHSEWSCSRG